MAEEKVSGQLLHDPLADQARSQVVIGPYRIIKGRVGFRVDREPTEAEATEALRWIAGLKEMTDWYLITWLASLPKEYGRTYWLAQEYFPEYKQKTLENMRQLGANIGQDEIRPELSVSHYLCIYTWYEIPAEERREWVDRLMAVFEQPNSQGRTWSVKQLSDEIKKAKGLIAQTNNSDDDHQLMLENHKLKGELVTTQADLMQAEKALREAIPILQESGAEEAAVRLIELVNAGFQASPSPWRLNESGNGHDLTYREETPIGQIETKLWEGLPNEAILDLKRRLEIP
jgi:hypothetical protein